MKALKFVVWTVISIVLVLCSIWAIGALHFDCQTSILGLRAPVVFVAVLLAGVIFLRGKILKATFVFAVFVIVVLWWLNLKPSNDHQWQPDVAETGWATIEGDLVTVHNVRNCEYRTETDFTPRWETRTVRLSEVAGMDIAITNWGSPWMAHPIVSFRFANALPLCFSIETRKMVGQEYSAIRGLFRQFTLTYIVADERDPIRLRTNYRKGEEVYLYRIMASRDEARERFLEYLRTLNSLHDKPRWYNAVTTNCTTAIRTQHPVNQRIPWDWRILANGKGDAMLYERHLIATAGLSFTELKQRSHINERARSLDADPDFSQHVREGLPGFD